MATVVTSTGIEWVTDKITETVDTQALWIGSSTGAGTAAVGDLQLFALEILQRSSSSETQSAADTVKWLATQTYADARDVLDAGNFTTTSTDAVGGLIVHGDFSAITVANLDSIQFTITLQVT